jgi:hypothetical protein
MSSTPNPNNAAGARHGVDIASDGTESRGGVVAVVTNAQYLARGSGFSFTREQRTFMETIFQQNSSPSVADRQRIANRLGVHYSSVTNWFGDRRRPDRGHGS